MADIIKFPDRGFHDRRASCAFIGIDYDEFKPDTYRGAFVSVDFVDGRKEEFKFGSYDAALAYAASLGVKFYNLSSVDNYVADVRSAANGNQ